MAYRTFVWLMQKIQHRSANKILVVTLLFMVIGTAMELYLLDHYEDSLQLIPLLCLAAALLSFAVVLFRPSSHSLVVFKAVLGLNALSGLVGIYLHLEANYEFELEMKPGAAGWELFTESLAGALPALAPGSMIALALIGYSYTLLINKKS